MPGKQPGKSLWKKHQSIPGHDDRGSVVFILMVNYDTHTGARGE